MGINIGNNVLKNAYVGSNSVKKIYVGDKLVWPAEMKLIHVFTDLYRIQGFFMSNFGNWMAYITSHEGVVEVVTRKLSTFYMTQTAGEMYSHTVPWPESSIISISFSYSGTVMMMCNKSPSSVIHFYELTGQAFRPDLGVDYMGATSYETNGLFMNTTGSKAVFYNLNQSRLYEVSISPSNTQNFSTVRTNTAVGVWDAHAAYGVHHYFARKEGDYLKIKHMQSNSAYDISVMTEIEEGSTWIGEEGFGEVCNLNISSTGEYLYVTIPLTGVTGTSYHTLQYELPQPFSLGG